MKLLISILLLTLAPASFARADHEIAIRVSYKIIRNPADSSRPPGVTDAVIDAGIAEMNTLLSSFKRGYRFERVDPITDIGSTGNQSRPNPSHYYDIDALAVDGTREQMESDALANQTLYAWNASAINIYINHATGGGKCAFPTDSLIVVGANSSGNGELQIHEIGHFFNLCHTQGCPCGCCFASGQTGECNTAPGDDGVSDTLPDLACWSRDEVAQNNFGAPYSSLAASQQNRVDDVFFNIMSYHAAGCGHANQTTSVTRMTEQQLDRWTNTAYFSRSAVCSGQTYFVQAGANPQAASGRSDHPFPAVGGGIGASNASGDIVMIRGGTYPETLRLSTPITLRSPRGHTARIGQ
jgi:hypothetical protein